MAAYAALLSLKRVVEQIQRHTRLPISLDVKQMESLNKKVTFLIDYLESDSHGRCKEAEDLESRITDAAYAAEDIIETCVVDKITAFSKGETFNTLSYVPAGIEKVLEDIVEEVFRIKNRNGIEDLQVDDAIVDHSPTSISIGKNAMVGFHEDLTWILEQLIGQQKSGREIISIVGMGGIGKTTLAKTAYEKAITVEHFDVRAWVSISQEYSRRQILLGILLYLAMSEEDCNNLKQLSDVQLGTQLHQLLCGWRYLVVLDDMWSIEAWDMIRNYLPDYKNGSRIIVTTRISKVATDLNSGGIREVDFLDGDTSWNLLCEKAFPEEGCCPHELVDIGRQIARNCKGLPLSIVVIGGLLANSKRTKERWEYVARNTNLIVNLEDDKHCMNLLSLSYYNLPVHLKPCFLYMGAFPEDKEVRVTWLINLWVAEGILKPDSLEDLEVAGEKYLNDLISRNLISVRTLGSRGKIKLCGIHDLLRDLCLRQARKEKFMCTLDMHRNDTGQDINAQRRISIHEGSSKEERFSQVLNAHKWGTVARSFICEFCWGFPFQDFRLLRVLKVADGPFPYNEDEKYRYLLDDIFHLVNSRYIAVKAIWNWDSIFPSSLCLLWNLQMLIVRGVYGIVVAPLEIWEMTELRLIEVDTLCLPDPPCQQMDGRDNVLLKNLRTLSGIVNFRCSDEVVKRIPNLRKLKISYENMSEGLFDEYCFKNLSLLKNLESLDCSFLTEKRPSRTDVLRNLDFPWSLKKLALHGCHLYWEDMTMIGSLPDLEVLKLKFSFNGPEWNPVEGEFGRLTYLLLSDCSDLMYWIADSTHFPCLRHLVLKNLRNLVEIPSDIGNIDTLQSIEVSLCSDSVVKSAKDILNDQEALGNHMLQVRVMLLQENPELENLASDNFRVQVCNIL